MPIMVLMAIINPCISALIDPSSGLIVTPDEMQYLQGDPPITHKVSFQILKSFLNEDENRLVKEDLGTITVGLFGMTVPKTVYNFLELANMTLGFGYKDVLFHRIIRDFMIQGGDFQSHNTNPHKKAPPGVKCIYGEKFDDENFTLRHNKRGRLSMANAGSNTNGGQFFITTQTSCDWLDTHHVVFGQLIEGEDTLDILNDVKTDDRHKPIDDYMIGNIMISVLFDIRPLLLEKNIEIIENTATLGTPGYNKIETVNPPINTYKYLIIFSMLLMIIWIVNKVYLRRQYITDIKDANYF